MYRSVQNVQAASKRLPINCQRRKQLDNLILSTASLYDKPSFKGFSRDFPGQFTCTAIEPQHHAPSAHGQTMISAVLSHLPKAFAYDATLFQNTLRQLFIRPVFLQRGSRGHERKVVASECAVVLARLPNVQFGLEQQQGQR